MKKLYGEPPWKEHSARRSAAQLQPKLGRSKPAGHQRRQGYWLRGRRALRIKAPSVFSLVQNHDEMLFFIGLLKSAFARNNSVVIDMRDVNKVTSDGVIVMLSKLSDEAFVRGNDFGGNQPRNRTAREGLQRSGFFEFVSTRSLVEPSEHGRIRRKKSFQVESEIADELIRFATTKMFHAPQCRPGVYRVLVECMGNTHEHAPGGAEDDALDRAGRESWWATVYVHETTNRASFTFVDNGVGIFRSVTVRKIRRLLGAVIGDSANPKLLEDILQGRIQFPSRTGKKNRGKGLRAIFRQFQAGTVKELVIIANDVFADVARGRYDLMKIPFAGTLLHWEIE